MRDYENLTLDLRERASSYEQMFGVGESSIVMKDAAAAIEELLRWRGHSFLRWEKENYKTPPTEVFHDRYYDAMQVVHAICNANPPEGVSPETFRECLAAVFREIEELPTIKFPPKEVV